MNDLGNEIEIFMRKMAKTGHFEFTINEIIEGFSNEVSRGKTFESLVRMEEKKIITTRAKGKTTLYYLSILKEICNKSL